MRKIIMFTGKGGVGKTTMSVATALHLARERSVLLLSTDPSGSLSSIFNKAFHDTVVSIERNLDAIELTRPIILNLWREKFGEDVYRVISSLLPVDRGILDYIEGVPALDEEFMLDYVLEAKRLKNYDHIIWDTAPTSSTLNLLNIQNLFYSHLGEAQKLYLKMRGVLSRLKGGSGEEPLELIARWRKLTEDILGMLSRDTSTWIVANPERLPVEQALSIGKSLSGFGVEIKGYILNRIFSEDVCAESEFLRKKREHQIQWRDRLIAGADHKLKIIHEIQEDATTRDMLVTIAHILYGQPQRDLNFS
ncbi:MAG: ArsA family ATPase [Deltaproteobacteria bacterium]|nr:ArsA family ATPase [Deltaproteobacteria bacterium]MBN2845518.1 ArsA family ATPase [Deltaproteobacteria bacterium]